MDPETYIPPYDVEAEQSILGAMMISEDAALEAHECIRQSDFYRPVHQEIYAALCALVDRKEPSDQVTLTAELRKREQLENCGGTEYLFACVERVPTAANVKHYCGIVRGHSQRRQVIAECTGIIATVQNDPTADAMALLTERALAMEVGYGPGVKPMSEVVGLVWDRIEAYQKGEAKRGIPWGIEYLDYLTYGVGAGEFVLVAARPSDGKTVLLTQLGINAALRGVPTLMFSAEMSAEEIIERAMVMQARVDGGRIRAGHISDEEWTRLGNSTNDLYQAPFFIDDLPASTARIASVTQRAILRHKIGLILVDYIQLVEWPGRAENRNIELGNVTRALKRLARQSNVPVVAACQLGRGMLKREDKRPNLGDLRESGNLEAEADKVILLYNPHRRGYTDTPEEDKPERIQAQAIVEKHRGGPTGAVTLWWTPTQTRFDTCTEPWIEPVTHRKQKEDTPWSEF